MVHIPLWVLALLIIGAAVFGGLAMLVAIARTLDGSPRR